MECKHHPDAEPDEVKRLDDFYEVARYYKEHENGGPPEVVKQPSQLQLVDMELEALNLSLTQSAFVLKFKPHIDARVFTEREIEELPAHPKRNGKKHGNWCTCSACRKSQCVIAGEITNVKEIVTKNKDKMAFVDVAYEANQYACTLFPKTYEQYRELLKSQATCYDRRFHGMIAVRSIVLEIDDVFSVAEEQGWEVD